ncbi:MAG: leucine-rich repeat domain-containing protein [Clostridia bacterium]|nr:leucine-rich repeat domain-containing protein [Clostridia bacterium]
MKKKWLFGLATLCAGVLIVGSAGCTTPSDVVDGIFGGGTTQSGGTSGGGHTHSYTQRNVEETYLFLSASCKSPVKYYYSCSCGEKGVQTFDYGSASHTADESGICTKCGQAAYSLGLAYEQTEDGTGYIVTGLGDCEDTDIVIPSYLNGKPVVEIAERAFASTSSWGTTIWSKITSIDTGDSVKSIGDKAFYKCGYLQSAILGKNVASIGSSVFEECSWLDSITVTGELRISAGDIADTAFYKNSDNWENGVLYLGKNLVDTKTSVGGKYKVRDGIKYISGDAFVNCITLKEVFIPDSVENISAVFYGCEVLSSITVSENNTAYKSVDGVLYSKDEKGLIRWPMGKTGESFVISDNVTYIDCAIRGVGDIYYEGNIEDWCNITCEEDPLVDAKNFYVYNEDEAAYNLITELVIPDSVTRIPGGRHYFKSIVMGNGITSIGNYAFSGCDNLTSVVIGDSVTSIGNYAFSGCDNITNVYYKGTANDWKRISISGWGNDALTNATRYYYIENEADLPDDGGNYWHYVDGVATAW